VVGNAGREGFAQDLRMASTNCLAWRNPGTVISLTMNILLEPSSTLSVHENQVRGMSNTT
jgi:hypothetical protein